MSLTLFTGSLAAKVSRNDSLAQFLSHRPSQKDLEIKNILRSKSDEQRVEDRQRIGQQLSRWVSIIIIVFTVY